jgi:lysophospholipase L1-like esterase
MPGFMPKPSADGSSWIAQVWDALTLLYGTVDSLGNLAGLKNPGPSGGAKAFGQLFLQRPLRIVTLGDSLTQGPDVATGLNNQVWNYSPGAAGFVTGGVMLSGPRLSLIRNAGIAGQTSTQIAARINTDALAYNPDIVTILAGTNDLVSLNTNFASGLTTLMNNLQTMVQACLSAGVVPVLVTPPPHVTYPSIAKLIQWFYYDLARAYRIPLFDMYRLCVDPLTGTYLSGYSGDGIHPQRAGVTVLAPAFATFLNNLTTAAPYKASYAESVAATTGTEANLILNGNFARSASPPRPDSWGSAGGVGSDALVAASAPYNGNTYTRTVTSGSQYAIGNGANMIPVATYTAGTDVLQITGAINVNIATYASNYNLALTETTLSQYMGLKAASLNGQQDFCWRLQVPSNWSTAYLQCFSGGDAGTIALNNLTVVNVTRLRALWSPLNPE